MDYLSLALAAIALLLGLISLGVVLSLKSRMASHEQELLEVREDAFEFDRRINLLAETRPPVQQNTSPISPTSPGTVNMPFPPASPIPPDPTPLPPAIEESAIALSPEEQARQLLQQRVAQVQEKQLQQSASPLQTDSLVDLPMTDTGSEDGSATVKAVPQQIACPNCGDDILVSTMEEGSRYVCDSCGTPVKF